MKIAAPFATTLLALTVSANANSYLCKVKKVATAIEVPSKPYLAKHQPHVIVYDYGKSAILQRCDIPDWKTEHECDKYQADKIERNNSFGGKKYYYYRGQYDVQIFPNMTFVENNGRGMIAFGSCVVFQ